MQACLFFTTKMESFNANLVLKTRLSTQRKGLLYFDDEEISNSEMDTPTSREGVATATKNDQTSKLYMVTTPSRFVLWRDMAQNFEFDVNDVVLISNAKTSTFNNKLNLTTTPETTMTKISDQSLEEMRPEVYNNPPPPTSVITSINTKIMSLKDFKATVQCINCHHSNILSTSQEETSQEIIECPACSATFLLTDVNINNECSMMLKGMEKQWYTAKTRVMKNIFNWVETKTQQPSLKDKMNLLKQQFTMRVDMHNKIVEHAERIDHHKDDQEQHPSSPKHQVLEQLPPTVTDDMSMHVAEHEDDQQQDLQTLSDQLIVELQT